MRTEKEACMIGSGSHRTPETRIQKEHWRTGNTLCKQVWEMGEEGEEAQLKERMHEKAIIKLAASYINKR